MKLQKISSLLCLVALASACGEASDRVTPAELKEAMDAGEAIALDVRSLSSYVYGHIKGAKHIFYYELEGRLNELPRDKRVIAYCS